MTSLGRREGGAGRAMLPTMGGESDDDPAANLALEEALFLRNERFIVRVWENRESVIIGRAQLAGYETDVGYCKAHGIPVVRRFTAGGTVYNGPGNLNWSIFVARGIGSGSLRYESSPHAIFSSASSPVLSALAASGVEAWLDPPNRILTREGKISGMAAYVSRKGFLCHGTLLVGADLARVKALTTPSPEALERRYTRSRDARTANAQLDVDSFIHTLVRTLADETKLAIEMGSPDEGERELARDLLATRYGSEAWNLGDPFAIGGKAGEAALVR
ncbi:MAG TPA: biotin/lipoate A/B protein ligase family protein [Nitrososphaerales archaeon]|nr:biotin/lipoate A/B protein ligase family protein [Nitrososphaerales archaeon]